MTDTLTADDIALPMTPEEARLQRLKSPTGRAIVALLHKATVKHVLAFAHDERFYEATQNEPTLLSQSQYEYNCYLPSMAARAAVELLTTAAVRFVQGLDPLEVFVGNGPVVLNLAGPTQHQARIDAHVALAKVKDKVRFQLAAGPDAPARLARAVTDCTCGPDGTPRPTSARGRHRRACPVAPAPKRSTAPTH